MSNMIRVKEPVIPALSSLSSTLQQFTYGYIQRYRNLFKMQQGDLRPAILIPAQHDS